MLEQRITTPEQQKWIAKLVGFDYEIVYRPGKENNAADALSRRSSHAELATLAVSAPTSDIWNQIAAATVTDDELAPIVDRIQKGDRSDTGYDLRHGCLIVNGRVVVPKGALRTRLLREFHESAFGGHSGILRTFKRVQQLFDWPGLKKDVTNFIRSCDTCQRNKADTRSPAGLLAPLPIPKQIWSDISMGFITGLPRSKGKDTILVVVDRMSKYAHFIALSHPYTAKDVADVFVRNVVRLHGIPKTIVSDRDRIFVSVFWRELFKMLGTQLKMSSAYHPQTDGQTEVVNRCLEQYL